jgi:hypothetical protein
LRTTERVAKMTTPKFHCDKCKEAFENTIWTYMKYQNITLGIDDTREIAKNTMDRVIEAITTFSPEIEGNTEYE